MINIMEEIGEPAVLEQLAEECAELSKAALKLARILREENPTPVTRAAARAALTEEKEDVMNCLYVHGNVGLNYEKLRRWEDRIRGEDNHPDAVAGRKYMEGAR